MHSQKKGLGSKCQVPQYETVIFSKSSNHQKADSLNCAEFLYRIDHVFPCMLPGICNTSHISLTEITKWDPHITCFLIVFCMKNKIRK